MKNLKFKTGGGMTAPNGKPDWPVSLRVSVGNQQAWDVVEFLLNRLRDNHQSIEFNLFGDMEGGE